MVVVGKAETVTEVVPMLGPKLESPRYSASIESEPAGTVEVVKLAVPSSPSVTGVPMSTLLARNWTEPVGVPCAAETVAVKVSGWP